MADLTQTEFDAMLAAKVAGQNTAEDAAEVAAQLRASRTTTRPRSSRPCSARGFDRSSRRVHCLGRAPRAGVSVAAREAGPDRTGRGSPGGRGGSSAGGARGAARPSRLGCLSMSPDASEEDRLHAYRALAEQAPGRFQDYLETLNAEAMKRPDAEAEDWATTSPRRSRRPSGRQAQARGRGNQGGHQGGAGRRADPEADRAPTRRPGRSREGRLRASGSAFPRGGPGRPRGRPRCPSVGRRRPVLLGS